MLFIIDVFAPTHGVLTFGGIIAFFLGALMLFDRNEPTLRLSLAWIIAGDVADGAVLHVRGRRGMRAQLLPAGPAPRPWWARRGRRGPIDAAGGKVFVEGEYWRAEPGASRPGQTVEIVGRDGLTLKVKPDNLTEGGHP